MKFLSRTVTRCFALCIALFALSVPAQAQQANKIPRIGYLAVSNEAAHIPRVAGLRQGLRELGYVEGQTSLSSTDTPEETLIGYVSLPPS